MIATEYRGTCMSYQPNNNSVRCMIDKELQETQSQVIATFFKHTLQYDQQWLMRVPSHVVSSLQS